MSWQALVQSLQDIHLLHPGWLWAWVPSVLAIGLLLRANRLFPPAQLPGGIAAQTYRHPRLATLRRLFEAGDRTERRGSPRALAHYAILLLCMHTALAQPYRLGEQLPTPPEYRDTVFVVDTSVTMILRDYLVGEERVDRMSILKGVLTRFVEQLQGNRIGLIAFSTRPYTLAPLTADPNLLTSMIARLEPAVLTGRTTDVGKALLYTLQQLQRADDGEAGPKPVVVLVSDVNRSPRHLDPREVAAHMNAQGFRMHTIGIGAATQEAREDLPVGLIYQPANFRLLRSIAEAGGGAFHWADSADSLQAAVDAIQSAERRAVEVEPRHVSIPLYQWPLLAGLLWLSLLQLRAAARNRPS